MAIYFQIASVCLPSGTYNCRSQYMPLHQSKRFVNEEFSCESYMLTNAGHCTTYSISRFHKQEYQASGPKKAGRWQDEEPLNYRNVSACRAWLGDIRLPLTPYSIRTNSKQSPLLSLPGEIRDKILRFLLGDKCVHIMLQSIVESEFYRSQLYSSDWSRTFSPGKVDKPYRSILVQLSSNAA